MSGKVLWTGLTVLLAAPAFGFTGLALIGAFILVVGLVLLWLDR